MAYILKNDCCNKVSYTLPYMIILSFLLLWWGHLRFTLTGKEKFFLYLQGLPVGLKITFTWDWLAGKKPKVLSHAHGGSRVKLRPKEMTKAGSFYTF